jgi:TRAP-type mannitol/chloroaromatic compound transport system permease large subunit
MFVLLCLVLPCSWEGKSINQAIVALLHDYPISLELMYVPISFFILAVIIKRNQTTQTVALALKFSEFYSSLSPSALMAARAPTKTS